MLSVLLLFYAPEAVGKSSLFLYVFDPEFRPPDTKESVCFPFDASPPHHLSSRMRALELLPCLRPCVLCLLSSQGFCSFYEACQSELIWMHPATILFYFFFFFEEEALNRFSRYSGEWPKKLSSQGGSSEIRQRGIGGALGENLIARVLQKASFTLLP